MPSVTLSKTWIAHADYYVTNMAISLEKLNALRRQRLFHCLRVVAAQVFADG